MIMRLATSVAKYQTRCCISLAEQKPNGLVRLAYIRLARAVTKSELKERSTINIICLFIGAVFASKKVLEQLAELVLAKQRNVAKSEISLLLLRLVFGAYIYRLFQSVHERCLVEQLRWLVAHLHILLDVKTNIYKDKQACDDVARS